LRWIILQVQVEGHEDCWIEVTYLALRKIRSPNYCSQVDRRCRDFVHWIKAASEYRIARPI
jgi:hypothetical protein